LKNGNYSGSKLRVSRLDCGFLLTVISENIKTQVRRELENQSSYGCFYKMSGMPHQANSETEGCKSLTVSFA
jgi:hypothetical protein